MIVLKNTIELKKNLLGGFNSTVEMTENSMCKREYIIQPEQKIDWKIKWTKPRDLWDIDRSIPLVLPESQKKRKTVRLKTFF